VSIAMNKNQNPPGALGKMPTILIPHIAKDRTGCACFIVCF
jgi:hypothetical protein